jgi:hypothetical protein
MQAQGRTCGCGPGTPSAAPGDRSLPVVNKGCCGGPDLGPISDDEGPSQADIARFNSETINCPKCRGEMYDEAEVCLHCGHILGEADKPGLSPWAVGTTVILIAALAMWMVF